MQELWDCKYRVLVKPFYHFLLPKKFYKTGHSSPMAWTPDFQPSSPRSSAMTVHPSLSPPMRNPGLVNALIFWSFKKSCGLLYKHIMIVNDTYRATSEWCHNLEHHSRSVIDNSRSIIGNFWSVIDNSRSVIANCRRVIDISRSIIDNSRSIIDNSRSIIDSSRCAIDSSRCAIDNSKSIIDNSGSTMNNSRSLIDNSRRVIDNYESVIDNSRSVIDNSRNCNWQL